LQADWIEAVALAGDPVEGLAQEAHPAGARFAVVATSQVYPERWERIVQRYVPMQGGQWDLEQPAEAARQVAQRAGMPLLDLLPAFRQAAAASAEPLHLRVDGHWTPAGKRLAAEVTADFLRTSGLLAAGS
jgi:hypothetical protein